MPVPLELGFSFATTPVSGADAYSDTGSNTNALGLNPIFDFGDVAFGSDGGAGGTTPITGLVRDIAVGVAVALLAKYLWGKIR